MYAAGTTSHNNRNTNKLYLYNDSREKVLLEQPTYARMDGVEFGLNIPYETIERKMDGEIDLNRLEKLFAVESFPILYDSQIS